MIKLINNGVSPSPPTQERGIEDYFYVSDKLVKRAYFGYSNEYIEQFQISFILAWGRASLSTKMLISQSALLLCVTRKAILTLRELLNHSLVPCMNLRINIALCFYFITRVVTLGTLSI